MLQRAKGRHARFARPPATSMSPWAPELTRPRNSCGGGRHQCGPVRPQYIHSGSFNAFKRCLSLCGASRRLHKRQEPSQSNWKVLKNLGVFCGSLRICSTIPAACHFSPFLFVSTLVTFAVLLCGASGFQTGLILDTVLEPI